MAHARDKLASYKRPEGRRDLAGTAEVLGQQDPAPRGSRSGDRAPDARGRAWTAPETSNVTVSETHLVMHGLAIKKHATPEDVAGILGLDVEDVRETLAKLVDAKRVVEAQRTISPGAGRPHGCSTPNIPVFTRTCAPIPTLQAGYAGVRASQRRAETTDHRLADDRRSRRGRSKRPQRQGLRRRIIDRLGDLHERAEGALDQLASALPRFPSIGKSSARRWKRPKTARSPGSATPRSKAITRCGSNCMKICCA